MISTSRPEARPEVAVFASLALLLVLSPLVLSTDVAGQDSRTSQKQQTTTRSSIDHHVRALESGDALVVEHATQQLIRSRQAAVKLLESRLARARSDSNAQLTERIRRVLTICRIQARPSRGLLVGLAVDPAEARKGDTVTFRTTLANVTGKPIVVMSGLDVTGNTFKNGSALAELVPVADKRKAPRAVSPKITDGLLCGTGAKPNWTTIPPYGSVTFKTRALLREDALKLPDAMAEFPIGQIPGVKKFRIELRVMTAKETAAFMKKYTSKDWRLPKLPELNPDPTGSTLLKMLGAKPPVPDPWHGHAQSNTVVLKLR